MKKGIIIGTAVVLIAATGAAAYYFLADTESAMTRRALMGNGSATCTYVDSETSEEATLYILDGDMRVETMAPPMTFDEGGQAGPQEEVPSNALFQDEVVYVWSDGEEQGFQFPMDEDELIETDEPIPLRSYEDEEQFERDYEDNQMSCVSGADAGLFELPEDVEFLDLADLMSPLFGPEFELPEQDGEEIDYEELEREYEEMMEQMEQERR